MSRKAGAEKTQRAKSSCKIYLLDRGILILDATVDKRRQGSRRILGGSRIFGDGQVLEKVVQDLEGLGVLLSRSHFDDFLFLCGLFLRSSFVKFFYLSECAYQCGVVGSYRLKKWERKSK